MINLNYKGNKIELRNINDGETKEEYKLYLLNELKNVEPLLMLVQYDDETNMDYYIRTENYHDNYYLNIVTDVNKVYDAIVSYSDEEDEFEIDDDDEFEIDDDDDFEIDEEDFNIEDESELNVDEDEFDIDDEVLNKKEEKKSFFDKFKNLFKKKNNTEIEDNEFEIDEEDFNIEDESELNVDEDEFDIDEVDEFNIDLDKDNKKNKENKAGNVLKSIGAGIKEGFKFVGNSFKHVGQAAIGGISKIGKGALKVAKKVTIGAACVVVFTGLCVMDLVKGISNVIVNAGKGLVNGIKNNVVKAKSKFSSKKNKEVIENNDKKESLFSKAKKGITNLINKAKSKRPKNNDDDFEIDEEDEYEEISSEIDLEEIVEFKEIKEENRKLKEMIIKLQESNNKLSKELEELRKSREEDKKILLAMRDTLDQLCQNNNQNTNKPKVLVK